MKNCIHALLFTVFAHMTIFAQQSKYVEKLYKSRDYKQVVNLLKAKSLHGKLSFDELFYITRSYGRLRNYNNGLAYSEKMMSKALEICDTVNLLIAYNLKAENLIDLEKIKEGARFCDSVSVFFREKDSIEFQKLCFKWGMLHYQNGNYKRAYEIYNKITKKAYRKLSLFQHNYALTLEGLQKYDEAIKYFKDDFTNHYQNSKSRAFPLGLTNIANIYLQQNKLVDAKKYLDLSREYLNENTKLYRRKAFLEYNYTYFKKKNQLDSALTYLEKIEKINEKKFDKKINEEIEDLKISYGKEKKLLEEVQKEKERRLILQQEKLKLTLLGLLVAVILSFLLFYFLYKNIRIKYNNLKLEQKILRSQITPHFIFNSFSVLQGIIMNREIEKATEYINKFSKLMRSMLYSSREEFIMLADELDIITNYIDLQNLKSITKVQCYFNVEPTVNRNVIKVPSMLLQPFVENSLEHGFTSAIENPEIVITISYDHSNLRCSIEDNGIGISKSIYENTKEKTDSLGLQITKERLVSLSKDCKTSFFFSIESRSNTEGTIVVFNIPYKTLKNA